VLSVVAPPVGLGVLAATATGSATLAGVGGLVGHFWRNIPKTELEALGAVLDDGQAALVVVAVDRDATEIDRSLARTEKKVIQKYEKGDLEGAYAEAEKGIEKLEVTL
jgi:hypothetical protein